MVSALAGCDVPNQVNPVWIYREVSGAHDAGRLPPPGMDGPRPNLASVPPRPERPTVAARAAVTEALAADRAGSREVLRPERDAPPAAGVASGQPPVPAGPPPPAALAAARPVLWLEAPAGRPLRPGPAVPPAAPAAPEIGLTAPPPPPPELLAPTAPR